MASVAAGKPLAPLRAAPGRGDLSSLAQPGVSCSSLNCSERAVRSLGPEDLCFEHFCGRCYALLEQTEGGIAPGVAALAAAARTLDECARRALEISVREIALDNLERARLIDIVLWSGDMTSALRRKVGSNTSKILDEAGSSELLRSGPANSRGN